MNHAVKGRKFSRKMGHRTSLFRSLIKSLVMHEQISTTLPKAKDLRPVVEKIITAAKRGKVAGGSLELHKRRIIISALGNDTDTTSKIFDVLSERYKDINGGYTRILKTGYRKGDAAPMAVIQFVNHADSESNNNVKKQSKKKVAIKAEAAVDKSISVAFDEVEAVKNEREKKEQAVILEESVVNNSADEENSEKVTAKDAAQ